MTFRPPLIARVISVVFFAAMVGVLFYAVGGLMSADGGMKVLLITVVLIPILMMAAATLRMLVLLSRRITVHPDRLEHRQLFKNHDVPFASITRIEVQRRADEEIGTIRILWSGPRFYLDSSSVEGWDDLLAALDAKLAPQGGFIEVSSFAVEEPGSVA